MSAEGQGRAAWYRGATPRAVLAAIVLTGFAVATQGLLTRGQSEELTVARAFLTAVFEERYDAAAGVVADDVDWLDEPGELRALVAPFRAQAGQLQGLTAAVAQRDDDLVREFVYCVDGADRDVAGRVEVTLASEDEPARIRFFSRFYSPAPCAEATPQSS